MGKFIVSVFRKFLFLCVSISVHFYCAVSEDLVTARPRPAQFHNLIPRFKIPPGNLLPYRIPQWEVLYFLKYGIVPFIFYDPHFNRTNFITQVHKFKMYFDDGRPNRTSQMALTDDDTFREFLRKHGYPNLKLPDNALSKNSWDCDRRNNKVAQEIDGLLRATGDSQVILDEKGNEDKGEENSTLPPSLEAIIKDLATEDVKIKKRPNSNGQIFRAGRQNFWNAFITKHPLNWKYSKSVVGTRNLLLNHASSLMPIQFPYNSFGRNVRSLRIDTRNVNMDNGGGDTDDRSSGSSDARKGGKTFQTQGW